MERVYEEEGSSTRGVIVVASVVAVVHAGRILVLRRQPNDRSFPHCWCLPGGRLEAGETPEMAAQREIREETGLEIQLVGSLGPRQVSSRERARDLVIHRFVGVAPHDDVRLSSEHVDLRWLYRDDAAQCVSLPGGLAGVVAQELLHRFSRDDL